MSEEKVVSVPDDKEVLELAKQVQANGWSVMHHILKQYHQKLLQNQRDKIHHQVILIDPLYYKQVYHYILMLVHHL